MDSGGNVSAVWPDLFGRSNRCSSFSCSRTSQGAGPQRDPGGFKRIALFRQFAKMLQRDQKLELLAFKNPWWSIGFSPHGTIVLRVEDVSSWSHVEPIEIHDFVPGRNKVVNELFLRVGTGVDFDQCAELRV
jgi:hypothetical protein